MIIDGRKLFIRLTFYVLVAILIAVVIFFALATPSAAMGDNLIGQVLDNVQERISAAWEWLWDPLWQWYAVGVAILIGVMLIAYFLPFKWVRAALGGFLLLVGAYIAGGRHMRQTYKDRLEEERAKRKALEAERRQRNNRVDNNSNNGDGFKWPWQW